MFVISVSVAFIPSVSKAQIQNPLKYNDIPSLVNQILGYVLEIGGVIAIFAFIYSGYRFVAAQGNTEKLKEAREVFFGTCIGVAILLGAKLIATIIVSTLNNLGK